MREFAEGNDIGFTLLHDEGGEVIERYGLRNESHTAGVIPHPTVLIVDREGRVQWKRVHEDYTTRPSVEAVLEAVREVGEPAG